MRQRRCIANDGAMWIGAQVKDYPSDREVGVIYDELIGIGCGSGAVLWTSIFFLLMNRFFI